MVTRNEHKYVIYPVYFDRSISRSKGRKLAKKYAIEKPTLEAIAKATQSLKLNPLLEREKMYSSTPWKKDGRILIEKKGPKTKLLIQIANRL